MTERNVLQQQQQWKRDENGATTSSGGFYPAAKTNVVATRGISESSSSSSFSIGNSGSAGSEIFHQQPPSSLQQQLPMPLSSSHHHQNFELQKLTSISKINSLAKISGFDGVQMPEDEKLRKFQQIVEAGVGDHAKQQILQILDKISLLKPPERLLLYLRMPGGTPETDPLRQPQNPLGTRSEINHTINWVRSHLEHDPKVSIPKQDVYNDYIAYCERVDIKPLSTADFGKVMKQVFPEVRPRRLGTRGHSRYCYAAMRKATKLDAPRLPDLDANSNVTDFNSAMDDDSWKVIKMWAEGLLNSNFPSIKDLASYISIQQSNSPASNSSRLLLQKKLLQRDAKEKRKFTDTSPLKKRRKKKRRSSSSSESAQLPSNGSVVDIKQEIMDPSISQLSESSSSVVSLHSHQQQQQQQPPQPQQQMVPMNLATEHDNNNTQKIQGTNLACDNNLVVGCSTKNLVAPNLSPICAPSIENSSEISCELENLIIKLPLNAVKEEIPDDYNSKIYCKKVRQAHQAKGLWNPSANIIQSTGNAPILPITATQNAAANYSRVSDGLMGPPAQMDSDHSLGAGFKRTALISGGISMTKTSSPNLQLRAKKLRYVNARMEAMQEEQATTMVKDGEIVLTENLGIPRERVISICNMDKHELDDYLNEEENSQDQEAELLQYFQPEDGEQKSSGNDSGNSANMGNQNAFPILENYQLYGNSKIEKKPLNQNEEEINQLRFYLQQNLQNNNKDVDSQTFNKSTIEQTGSYTGVYPGVSASASLQMMSQRHHIVMPEEHAPFRFCTNTGEQLNQAPMNHINNHPTSGRGSRRKNNLNARLYVPHSPNTRRKNFSFVPISPNANTHNNSVDYSPFVSPRTTPVVRKPPLHKQQSLPASDHHSLNDPVIGSAANSYGKNPNFSNTISSSAPPSPSLVQQRFRFAPTTSVQSSVGFTGLNNDQHFNHFQSVAMQCRIQNMNNNCNLDGNGESRSQSVPLHCRNSPAFNQSSNFPDFSSACSSVAQTPVPPEFTDFSDPSTILDIFGDASQPPIKLETNNIGASLLDDIASNESGMGGVSDLLTQDFDIKNNNNSITSISRSVPSTPLPALSFKTKNTNNCEQDKIIKMYDISKSVPTTPIAMNVSTFRYSPEFNRDYLISGIPIDSSSKGTSFYNQQQQQQQHQQSPTIAPTPAPSTSSDSVADKLIPTSLPENIDELSNFGVTESIIGSDILNNL